MDSPDRWIVIIYQEGPVMNFFRKIFGGQNPEGKEDKREQNINITPKGKPDKKEEMIQVFDEYGRPLFISKQEWKDKMLRNNLEDVKDNPDQLYNLLVMALQDGFASDIIPYAKHLYQTDPIPERGATILGITYMQTGHLDKAEEIFNDFISKHGENGVILTNLAKVYSHRGDHSRAESTLWHALEVDPNQDNGLDWYAAIHNERGGEEAAQEAFRRVEAIPGSWRPQLWLARFALKKKDIEKAKSYYSEALEKAGNPPPPDLLMQMSGDLGANGFVKEMIELAGPYYDPKFHGLEAGNNLLKANLELGRIEEARNILNELYAMKRPDWKETLQYWDTELGKADIEKKGDNVPEKPSFDLMTIEGPIWQRDGSPFASLVPEKKKDAAKIAILGSVVLYKDSPGQVQVQLSDSPGRLSRAVPLALTEIIHMNTDAVVYTMVTWTQDKGFTVFGSPIDDKRLTSLKGAGGMKFDYIFGVVVDARGQNWNLSLQLNRISDGKRLAETGIEAATRNPGPAVLELSEKAVSMLMENAGVNTIKTPSWYEIPPGGHSGDYLLRIEQQLAVMCSHLEFLKGGGLTGEREILDGALHLCVNNPKNHLVRMVIAQTLRQMKKVRPDIFPEYREKINRLQKEYPLVGEVGDLIDDTISETFRTPV